MANKSKILYDGRVFSGLDIKGGKMHIATSLLSSSLEANTFSPVIKSDDRTLVEFKRNTPMIYFYNDRQKGVFYVQDVQRTGPDLYQFSATSAIGLLSDGQHYGGIYTGQTVSELLPGLCGTVPYAVKSNLEGIKLYGWLPVSSPRDNLAQVLFAIGATVKNDLDGVLRIETLWNGISGDMGRGRMYQGPSVKYGSEVTRVIVTEHQYVEGGDEKKLFEGTAQQGDIITFDGPMYGLKVSGFSILEHGANYAKVSAGSGTLTGHEYVHNTREVYKDVSTAQEPNVKTAKNATLVSLVNSNAVAQRMANYFQWVETIQTSSVYLGENPGNRLAVWHPYNEIGVTACLESADINLSNTLKADESLLVGFIPPKEEQIVTYDNHELLTGNGTWTVPEGVTEVVAVLIGGGGAGHNGSAGTGGFYGGFGENTYKSEEIQITRNDTEGKVYSKSTSCTSGGSTTDNGTGGSGGAAGTPGNVLQTTISVTAGEQISFSCGFGGQTNGQNGGNTTFGAESSASGSATSTGYTDVVTGVTYAKAGTAGEKGGDGGVPGNSGSSAGGASGGSGVRSRSYDDSGTDSASNTIYSAKYSASASGSVAGAGGGGAGGQASGKNGSSGGGASNGSFSFRLSENTANGTLRAPVPGDGGAGASGNKGESYGSSGDGGGGGGGFGAF